MRMLSRISVLLILLAGGTLALGQAQQSTGKRALTHDDYDGWQSIRGRAMSRDGSWVAFTVAPQVGDGELIVRHTTKKIQYRQPRGTGARFSPDGRHLVFRIEAPREEKRAYELEKLRKRKKGSPQASASAPSTPSAPQRGSGRRGRRGRSAGEPEPGDPGAPKSKVVILDLSNGGLVILEKATSYRLPEEGPSFLIYQLEKPKEKPKTPEDAAKGRGSEEKTKSEKKAGAKESAKTKETKTPEYLKDGFPLVLRELRTGKETRIEGVVSHHLTRKRGFLLYACNAKKDAPAIARGLHAIELASGKRWTLVKGAAEFRSFTTDREDRRIAFLSNRADREAEKPRFDLYAWDFEAPQAEVLVASHGASQPFGDHRVATDASLSFCHDGQALLLGVEPPPLEELEPLLPEDEVKLDLWHWKDELLQPMQARRASQLARRAIACVWNFDSGTLVRVGRSPQESIRFLTPNGSRLLVSDGEPYGQLISWDARYTDIHVVSAADGSRRRVLKRLRGGVQASPDGRYLLYFAAPHWHCLDLLNDRKVNLTRKLKVSFAVEDWDTPEPARPYGEFGWTTGEAEVILADEYDLWRIDPSGAHAACITEGVGRTKKISFRPVRLDREQRHWPLDEPILLSARHLETKATGFYTDRIGGVDRPHRLIWRDMDFGALTKAEESDRVVFTLSSFVAPPDLWTARLGFEKPRKLSKLNPQQKEIRWGRAEIVRWHSGDGKPLKGILIKPDGFDPKRKYPMMVYFYEKLSNRLHRYVEPGPGTSPNAAYYVSNGYLWFMPDIHYEKGYPGESCVKCVVSGVQHLIDAGFVDPGRIGAAGHSWGGYQTAFLITRTDIFAAVESGAPVSNMTSAYGGIRWGTGMSRAFQYERNQSRIGDTLWKAPMRYIENSPLFRADRVRTPILMLHNDQDGAVPWYQGIEYFCALRRLRKEAYMFNYNGADHGLRKRANMLDWTMRMQQYFDHHLRGAPAPEWMRRGVPYVEREREKRRFRPVDYPEPEKKRKIL